MDELEKQFQQPMEQLGKMHEHSKVFVDFMDYYISKNTNNPGTSILHGYKETEMQLFEDAYNGFNKLMTRLLEKYPWYDYIGEYYEKFVLAGSKASSKGQFYTPRAISDLLSQVTGCTCELGEAYDPACGSARNLLDYHSKHPDVRCTGEDLDESACKMAVLNFHAHGVDGVVNWIDALTREYMGTSWRIVGGRIVVTDMEWIRAVDDVVSAVNILSLSDDTIKQLCHILLRQEDTTDKEENKTKTGLDQWM